MGSAPYFLRNPALDQPPPDMAPPAMMAPPPQPVNPIHAMTAPLGPTHDAQASMMQAMQPPAPMSAPGEKTPAKEAPPKKMSPLDQQEEHVQGRLMADYQKDADPYGSPDNHPGFFGKLLHGLNVATGGVNRRQMEEQGLGRQIQGIEAEKSKEGLEGAQAGNFGADEATKEAKLPYVPQEEEAGIGEKEAQTGEANARANALNNPQPEYEVHDTAEGPMIVNKKTGIGQHLAVNGLPVGPKVQTKAVQLEIGGKPHQVLVNDADGTVIRDMGESGEKPPTVNVNAGEAALDRETSRLAKPYEKGISDANAQLEKIADARAMVNGSAEAQALGVPKVLTALVSGQGSGVRITQPELNAIAKARGLAGDVEGTLRSWSGQGKLTPEQQKQLTGILDDVQQRILAKQAIHSAALDSINGAASRADVIKADREARQKINDLEKGAGDNHGPQPGTVENGYRFKGGDPAKQENWEKAQ